MTLVAAARISLAAATTRSRSIGVAPDGSREPRRRALSYAILAPNPHNRQPWLVDLRGENTVAVFRDTQRDLPDGCQA